jgi:arsenate reductase (thioredoxin)
MNAPRRPGILFLCVANSVRSQIAEGLANRLAPPDVEIYSAGSSPARISAYAVHVLEEVGIDATGQYSKPIEAIPHDRIGTVITLCADEVCPVFPADVTRLHWPLADPTSVATSQEDVLAGFRRIRDELSTRLQRFFASYVRDAG